MPPAHPVTRHSPLRLRLRTSRAARVRLAADALHDALDRLTHLETPLAVRVAVDGDLVALTTHDSEQGWFATVATRGNPASPRTAAAVTVDLLLLREVIEYGRLATSGADTILTVRNQRGVGLSRWSVRASRVAPQFDVPPGPGGWSRIAEGCVLPVVTEREGTTTFPIPGGSATARNAVLERMTRRDLGSADIYKADGRVFLVASDARAADEAISVIGAARLVYDTPST